MWLTSGGVKPGQTIGQTDELGFGAVADPVHAHDLHATILHLLGTVGGQTQAGVLVLRPFAALTGARFAAGGAHTVALREEGTLWAWGDNGFGQIAQPVNWLPYPVLGGAVWGPP